MNSKRGFAIVGQIVKGVQVNKFGEFRHNSRQFIFTLRSQSLAPVLSIPRVLRFASGSLLVHPASRSCTTIVFSLHSTSEGSVRERANGERWVPRLLANCPNRFIQDCLYPTIVNSILFC